MRNSKSSDLAERCADESPLLVGYRSFYFYPMMFSYPIIRVVDSEGAMVGPLRQYIRFEQLSYGREISRMLTNRSL